MIPTRVVVNAVNNQLEAKGLSYHHSVIKELIEITGESESDCEEAVQMALESRHIGHNYSNSKDFLLYYTKPAGDTLLRLLKESDYQDGETFQEYVESGCFAPQLTIQELLDAATVGLAFICKLDQEQN